MHKLWKLLTAIGGVAFASLGVQKNVQAALGESENDDAAWQNVREAGTPQAFQDFVGRSPNSAHTAKALEALIRHELASGRTEARRRQAEQRLADFRTEPSSMKSWLPSWGVPTQPVEPTIPADIEPAAGGGGGGGGY